MSAIVFTLALVCLVIGAVFAGRAMANGETRDAAFAAGLITVGTVIVGILLLTHA